jgi:hypothetical protein
LNEEFRFRVEAVAQPSQQAFTEPAMKRAQRCARQYSPFSIDTERKS